MKIGFKKLGAACRLNEPQIITTIGLTALNLVACASAEYCHWGVWVGAGLFYPILVVIINLIMGAPE